MSRDESRRSKRSRVDRDYGVGPAADIMTYDDERTLDEEEALEASEDTHNELSHLQKESDMPLKDLLIMYGYGDISCDDANKVNDDEEEEDEEEEDDDDEEDEDEDDPASCEPDLKQFYTEMVKAEENGASTKSLPVKSDPVKSDETTDPPASTDTNTNPTNVEIKMEVTTNAEDATPPDPLSANSCNAEANTTVDNSNSNPGANAGSGGGGPSRLLRSVSRPQSEEEEDDCDYSPDEDEWKKTIMVGSDYQAAIPEGLCRYDDALPYENEDKMLWEPYHVKEEGVEEFLERAQLPVVKGSSLPSGRHVRDDEQALYLLLQCGYNLEEALRRRRMNALPSTESVSLWSEEECHNFESGLRNYGKDFHLIQKNKVRTRSVGELVQFYYLWKKTERHDIFTYKARLEKKKYALHPGITDYMDRFLEEQEGVRDRSSSPNVHCLLYGDNKRQRANTNSTNNEEQSKSAGDNWDRSNNTTSSTSATTTATVTSTSASTTNSSNSAVTGGETTVNNDSVDSLTVENHQQNSLKASVTLAATAFITSSSTSTTSSNIITTSSSSSASPSFSVSKHQHNNHHDQMQHETIVSNSHQPIINNNEGSVAARSPESILPHLPP